MAVDVEFYIERHECLLGKAQLKIRSRDADVVIGSRVLLPTAKPRGSDCLFETRPSLACSFRDARAFLIDLFCHEEGHYER